MATGKARLTVLAHLDVAAVVGPGDLAIDATAGNGHDTLFLAERVGSAGQVYALDIQATALEHTRRRVAAAGLADRVRLVHLGHEQLCKAVPEAAHGHVAAVMFNLGYLPGSDRRYRTGTDTTLAALDQAAACLRPGGVLTVIAYPGHTGGRAETEAVQQWMRRHPQFGRTLREICPPGDSAPALFIARRPGPAV